MCYYQGSPRHLAPGGADSENLKKFRREGKLIEFNGQFLAKSPIFCLKFFFNKDHIFFKDFCQNSIETLKGGTKENIFEKHF
jgi:hypothetical protein